MEQLNWDAAGPIADACRSNAADLAASLSSALGATVTLEVGEAVSVRPDATPAEWTGPALVVLLAGDRGAAAAIIPEQSKLLPAWCAAPDASGASRLATLAQEWAELALPEGFAASRTHAEYVDDARAALVRGGFAEEGGFVPLSATAGERTAQICLAWPLTTPEQIWTRAEGSPATATTAATEQRAAGARASAGSAPGRGLGQLPGFTRSLLKIRVPVSVQLAAKRERVEEVISLSPGSIIKFDKGCDQLLQMVVGEHPVAEGEAVKVGEKFGFRVSSMLLPPEHFVPLRRPRRA